MKTNIKRIIYTSIAILIIVFSSTFAILMTLERTDYRNYLQGQYSKNMFDLIDNVKNIRVDLSKSEIVGSREQQIVMFEEIFRHASSANDQLHSLPIGQETISETGKFLSQIGGFCYTLSKESAQGKTLNNSDYELIDRLKSESFSLETDLQKVTSDINKGGLNWGEIRKQASGIISVSKIDDVSEQFKTIQKQVVEYPSLIYDGPFSDNILNIKPKVNSQKQVTEKQAEAMLVKAVGIKRIDSIKLETSPLGTKISTYRYTVKIKGRSAKDAVVTCEISKNGGEVVYLLDGREAKSSSINMKTAISIGEKYLNSIGYSNVTGTYTLKSDNVAVVNYIFKQNGILIYPDQIKVKIALDDGSILGVEAEKYLIAHQDKRNLGVPKVSRADAQKKVSSRLNITSVNIVVIPYESDKEIQCYEFSGNYRGDNFKVYINCDTGYEQKIIQIINTPEGELVM